MNNLLFVWKKLPNPAQDSKTEHAIAHKFWQKSWNEK